MLLAVSQFDGVVQPAFQHDFAQHRHEFAQHQRDFVQHQRDFAQFRHDFVQLRLIGAPSQLDQHRGEVNKF